MAKTKKVKVTPKLERFLYDLLQYGVNPVWLNDCLEEAIKPEDTGFDWEYYHKQSNTAPEIKKLVERVAKGLAEK